jgi:hypothetical protein
MLKRGWITSKLHIRLAPWGLQDFRDDDCKEQCLVPRDEQARMLTVGSDVLCGAADKLINREKVLERTTDVPPSRLQRFGARQFRRRRYCQRGLLRRSDRA